MGAFSKYLKLSLSVYRTIEKSLIHDKVDYSDFRAVPSQGVVQVLLLGGAIRQELCALSRSERYRGNPVLQYFTSYLYLTSVPKAALVYLSNKIADTLPNPSIVDSSGAMSDI